MIDNRCSSCGDQHTPNEQQQSEISICEDCLNELAIAITSTPALQRQLKQWLITTR
jgi:predicted amidophosphoribosyltransferase